VAEADDIGRWSERVAGRGDALDPHAAEGDALRAAVRAEDAVMQRESAADRVGLERVLQRLEREGLLDSRPAATVQRDSSTTVGPRAGWHLPRWAAVAASVAVVAIGVRLLWPTAPVTPPATSPGPAIPAQVERPRGYAGVIKQTVADPVVEAARASDELKALGFAPRRIDADARRILEVTVTDAQLDAYRQFAEPRGGRVSEPGVYRVIFDPAP
jgi:hypothetical protein